MQLTSPRSTSPGSGTTRTPEVRSIEELGRLVGALGRDGAGHRPRMFAVSDGELREVDGSPPGEFNTGTHTAMTRSAYRVRSDVPVVVYQFNPLENVNVPVTSALP